MVLMFSVAELPSNCREEVWADEVSLTLEEFMGYQTTASGYQNYVNKHGQSSGEEVLKEFSDRYVVTCLVVQ